MCVANMGKPSHTQIPFAVSTWEELKVGCLSFEASKETQRCHACCNSFQCSTLCDLSLTQVSAVQVSLGSFLFFSLDRRERLDVKAIPITHNQFRRRFISHVFSFLELRQSSACPPRAERLDGLGPNIEEEMLSEPSACLVPSQAKFFAREFRRL